MSRRRGLDPIAEAECRGAILAVLRLRKNAPRCVRSREPHDAKKDVESQPILGPYRPGVPEKGLNLPSEAAMLRRLAKARPLGKGSQRHNVRMVVEPIADNVAPPALVSVDRAGATTSRALQVYRVLHGTRSGFRVTRRR